MTRLLALLATLAAAALAADRLGLDSGRIGLDRDRDRDRDRLDGGRIGLGDDRLDGGRIGLDGDRLNGGRIGLDGDRLDGGRIGLDGDRTGLGGGRIGLDGGRTDSINVLMFDSRADNLVASIVDANSIATTLAVQCDRALSNNCIRRDTWTVVQGPTTFASFSDNSRLNRDRLSGDQGDVSCQLDPNRDTASCNFADQGLSNAGRQGNTVVNDLSRFVTPVRVTSGADRLGASLDRDGRPRFPSETGIPGDLDGFPRRNAAAASATAPAVLAGAAAVVGALIL